MTTKVKPHPEAARSHELELVTAAHDLRNRLSIATNEIQQLSRCLAGQLDEDGAGCAGYLEAAGRSLAQSCAQLEELLEVACRQLADGLPAEENVLVDLVQVTRRVVALERHNNPKHRFVVIAGVSSLAGTWDEVRLSHIVHTLITNAVMYSPTGGKVVVRLDQQGEQAVLQVSDEGMGIPSADLPRVFEPFFRARNAERVAMGLGLGLSTAWLAVERYAGSLKVESTEGRGTTCTVCLPLNSRIAPSMTCQSSALRPTPRSALDRAYPGARARAPRGRAPLPG